MNHIIRSTGTLCLTAAVLIVSSELLRLIIGMLAGPGSATTLTHTLIYCLAVAGMYVLLMALTAVYFGHHRDLGTLGLIGYLTASVGTVLVAGDWWFEAFAVPTIGAEAPDVLNLPPGGSLLLGAVITSGFFASGWILFGVAVLRSGTFSRPAGVLLVMGGAFGIPLALSTPYQLPLAFAVGWLGYTLMRRSGDEWPVPKTSESASKVTAGRPSP